MRQRLHACAALLGLLALFGLLALPAAAADKKSASQFQKQLENFVKGNRAPALYDLIGEMAEVDEPKVAVLVPVAGVTLPSARNYKAALEAIAGYKAEATVAALGDLLKRAKTDYRQKTLILEGFGKREDRPSLEAIIAELKNTIVNVRVAAIRAARERKARDAVAPLTETLEEHWKRHDRVWYEAREALIALTGRDFETIDDWKKYVAALPADFDPRAPGKEEGVTRVEVKRTEESVEFFGTEIFSHNLLFVVDVSGSMVMFDEVDDYKGSNPEQDRQRLRRAKEQLTATLKKLPRGAKFNLITYSDKVQVWQKVLQPAAPATVASALKFVNDFKAVGATHTDEALEKAFEDLSVDTIVLLTDGAPIKKDSQDSKLLIDKILKRVKDLNAARKITINTFGFEGRGEWPKKLPFPGRPPPPPTGEDLKNFVEFLKSLAADSGGSFQALK